MGTACVALMGKATMKFGGVVRNIIEALMKKSIDMIVNKNLLAYRYSRETFQVPEHVKN